MCLTDTSELNVNRLQPSLHEDFANSCAPDFERVNVGLGNNVSNPVHIATSQAAVSLVSHLALLLKRLELIFLIVLSCCSKATKCV